MPTSKLLDRLLRALDGPACDRHRGPLAGLVGGNLLLMMSYAAGWIQLGELLWTYWLQSVAIGAFNYRRMMALQRFSTEGLKSNGRSVPETPQGKRSTAIFFLFHYGFFHLVYAGFLSRNLPGEDAWLWLVLCALGFLAGEWASHRRHVENDATWAPNLGVLLFQPYLRIIPMHLAILAMGLAGAVLLPMKLAADIGMYLVDEHLDEQRARAQQQLAAEESGAPAART